MRNGGNSNIARMNADYQKGEEIKCKEMFYEDDSSEG